MLDAYQVEVIAAIRDGGIYHARAECLSEYSDAEDRLNDDDGYIPDDRRLWQLLRELGIEPLIRFEMDEIESAKAADIDTTQFVDDAINGYFDDLTVLEFVERFTATHCDSCGRRIE